MPLKTSCVFSFCGALACCILFAPAAASAYQQIGLPPQPVPQTGSNMDALMGGKVERQVSAFTSPKLTSSERKAITRLKKEVDSSNFTAAVVTLQEAKAVAKTKEARFLVAGLELQLGQATNDRKMQLEAIQSALASGEVKPELLPSLYRSQGELAVEERDYAVAESAFGKLLEHEGNDPDTIILLGEVKNRAGKSAEALELMLKAITLKEAAKEQVPESWTRAAQQLSARLSSSQATSHN